MTASSKKERVLSVFSFLNYREYLRRYYEEKKARSRGFSYRSFARRVGLTSPNYLKLVIEGKRNLTPEMAERFAKACGLEAEAQRYFLELVVLEQAKSASVRNASRERLYALRPQRQVQDLAAAQAAYHATWYLPAIRELVSRQDFRDEPAWVAAQLLPPIREAEAKAALETLLGLGLLRRKRGRIVQGELLLSTGPETTRENIVNYHREMMRRASESMDHIPAQERDISSLTLCLSEEGLQRFKERIRRFRRELLDISADESEPTRVVQINFQLFPLSRGRGEGE